MEKKAVSAIVSILLLTSMLTLASSIQPVKARFYPGPGKGAATFYVTPQYNNFTNPPTINGTWFTVDLRIANATFVAAWQVELWYNKNYLYTNASMVEYSSDMIFPPGTYLPVYYPVVDSYNSTHNWLLYIGATYDGVEYNATDAGLTTVEFQIIQAPTLGQTLSSMLYFAVVQESGLWGSWTQNGPESFDENDLTLYDGYFQITKRFGTIYIRPDGTIDPPEAPIQRSGSLYTLTDNIFSDNHGIVVQRSNVVIDGNGHAIVGFGVQDSEGIDLSSRNNVTVKNIRIDEFWTGIHINYGSLNNITGNDITSIGRYGVLIWQSSGNSINGNNVTNHAPKSVNNCGIYLGSTCTDNNITTNRISACNWGGVYIDGVSSNRFSGNVFVDDGLIVGFMPIWDNIVENNLVNNKDLVYFEDASDLVIEDAGQVILVNCTDITVRNLNLSNTSVGVELWKTYNSTITNSTIATTNMLGIFLWSSSGNNITGNNITNNALYGVQLWYSSDNKLCHNNIVNNTIQALAGPTGYSNLWDDGYPSGGNCWSDYDGSDRYRGPDQDLWGSDGIGDTTYVVGDGNTDRYPLMKSYPWDPYDVGITFLNTSKTGCSPMPTVSQGYNASINIILFNYGSYTETFNLTVYANTTILAKFTNIILENRNSTTIIFHWNTTGFVVGNYTISAYAWPVSGETDIIDNTLSDWVIATYPGDVNADRKVDGRDLAIISKAFGSRTGQPLYNPNADINDDGKNDGRDIAIASKNFGTIWP